QHPGRRPSPALARARARRHHRARRLHQAAGEGVPRRARALPPRATGRRVSRAPDPAWGQGRARHHGARGPLGRRRDRDRDRRRGQALLLAAHVLRSDLAGPSRHRAARRHPAEGDRGARPQLVLRHTRLTRRRPIMRPHSIHGFLVALALLALAWTAPALADETCNSPYMGNLIRAQEDFVYVWTLGVRGGGDGSDKLVTIDANPSSARYGKVIHKVSVGGRGEAHHMGFTDDRRFLW